MKFEYPEIEVVEFTVEDVITASSGDESTFPSGTTLPNMTPIG